MPYFALFNWTFSPLSLSLSPAFRYFLIVGTVIANTVINRDTRSIYIHIYSFVILILNKQKVITPRNYTDASWAGYASIYSRARACSACIHGKDRYRLSADCDIQRCGQQRRVIQREIVDALQHHQRTSVTADLRASRCSPQRKIRTLPEMRSTPFPKRHSRNPSSVEGKRRFN